MDWDTYCRRFTEEARRDDYSGGDIEGHLRYAQNIWNNHLPIIYDQEHLSRLVGIRLEYLRGASNRPKKYYRSFWIAKKSGGRRRISEPLPTLKRVQRWILTEILDRVPVSEFAKAYVRGRSIRDNARFHRRQAKVLRLDIRGFFGSIPLQRVRRIFALLGYAREVSVMLASLCCLNERLPQGAPTSPALSNIVCREIDARLSRLAAGYRIRFTRYADDITLSGEFPTGKVIRDVQELLAQEGFVINRKKTRLMKQHKRQQVTGIGVNDKMQMPQRDRRAIRQQLYYIRKHGVHGHLAHVRLYKRNYLPHLLGRINFGLFVHKKDAELAAYADEIRGIIRARRESEGIE